VEEKMSVLATHGRVGVDDDRAARFDELFRVEYPCMVRLAYALTRDGAEAEDLVQDSFVELYQRLDDIRKPDAYLRTTVANHCRNALRRRRVAELNPPAPPPGLSESADEFWDVLARLPEEQRVAVVLKYYGRTAVISLTAPPFDASTELVLVADLATQVAVGSDGAVWVVSSGPGGTSIDRRVGDDWSTVADDDSMPAALVNWSPLLLGVDPGGDVWVTYDAHGMPSGPHSLFEFDGEKWMDHSEAAMAGTNAGSFACCFVDMGVDGTVVAGGYDTPTRVYDGTAWTDAADSDATGAIYRLGEPTHYLHPSDWEIVWFEGDEATVVGFESPISGTPGQMVRQCPAAWWGFEVDPRCQSPLLSSATVSVSRGV
jgi:RNA polymerase sigma-70 factor (ECF subfamily)